MMYDMSIWAEALLARGAIDRRPPMPSESLTPRL